MTRTALAPRIALVAALLAGLPALTAAAAPAAATAHVNSDALVVPGDVRNAPASDREHGWDLPRLRRARSGGAQVGAAALSRRGIHRVNRRLG